MKVRKKEWFMDISIEEAESLLEAWNSALINGIMDLPEEFQCEAKFRVRPSKLGRPNEVGIYLTYQVS